MDTVTLYRINCYHAPREELIGESFSLVPWDEDDATMKGEDDGGKDYELPKGYELSAEDGVPVITVYNTASQEYENMDAETYVMGVLAGEMRNDWPMEALKAQAILARTFTLKFISEKDSMYPYADISTDVTEAQAYDASAVNERVRKAVEETRGEIMSYQGELPYAWFHAHAAGKTDLAKRAKAAGLDAIHDTVHEMARDEARHGKAFAGLLKRYFG